MRPFAHLTIAAALAGCFIADAQSAPYGVRSSLTIAAPPLREHRDTGWLTNAPGAMAEAHAQVSWAGPDTLRQEGGTSVSTTYGDMSASGWALTVNAAYQGNFQFHGAGADTGSDPAGWFYDRLTIESDTLAIGTVVTVDFDLDFFGSFVQSFEFGLTNRNWVDVTAGLVVEPVDPTHTWLGVGMSSYRALDTHQSGSLQLRVGQSFGIAGGLWLSAAADANFVRAQYSGSFEYDARALVTIRPGEAGLAQGLAGQLDDAGALATIPSCGGSFRITAASGTDYCQSQLQVPEPQTYAMVFLALAVLAGARLRRGGRGWGLQPATSNQR